MAVAGVLAMPLSSPIAGRNGSFCWAITCRDGRNRVTDAQAICPVRARTGCGSRCDGLSRGLMICHSRRDPGAVPGRDTRRRVLPSDDRSRDMGAERMPSLPQLWQVGRFPLEPVRPAGPGRLRGGQRAGHWRGSRNGGFGERRPGECAAGSGG